MLRVLLLAVALCSSQICSAPVVSTTSKKDYSLRLRSPQNWHGRSQQRTQRTRDNYSRASMRRNGGKAGASPSITLWTSSPLYGRPRAARMGQSSNNFKRPSGRLNGPPVPAYKRPQSNPSNRSTQRKQAKGPSQSSKKLAPVTTPSLPAKSSPKSSPTTTDRDVASKGTRSTKALGNGATTINNTAQAAVLTSREQSKETSPIKTTSAAPTKISTQMPTLPTSTSLPLSSITSIGNKTVSSPPKSTASVKEAKISHNAMPKPLIVSLPGSKKDTAANPGSPIDEETTADSENNLSSETSPTKTSTFKDLISLGGGVTVEIGGILSAEQVAGLAEHGWVDGQPPEPKTKARAAAPSIQFSNGVSIEYGGLLTDEQIAGLAAYGWIDGEPPPKFSRLGVDCPSGLSSVDCKTIWRRNILR